MKTATTGWMVVVEPKTKRGYESPYREEKIAAHTTIKGKGKIARIKKK